SYNGSQGEGVRMFPPGQIDGILGHIDLLLKKSKVVLLQERKEAQGWRDPQTHERYDWNFRVLSTWTADGRVLVNGDMIEIRYQKRNHFAVNKSQGAATITLREFFKIRGFGP